MSRIVVENVPDDLKQQFKAVCALEGTTIREKIIDFLSGTVETVSQSSQSGVSAAIKSGSKSENQVTEIE